MKYFNILNTPNTIKALRKVLYDVYFHLLTFIILKMNIAQLFPAIFICTTLHTLNNSKIREYNWSILIRTINLYFIYTNYVYKFIYHIYSRHALFLTVRKVRKDKRLCSNWRKNHHSKQQMQAMSGKKRYLCDESHTLNVLRVRSSAIIF